MLHRYCRAPQYSSAMNVRVADERHYPKLFELIYRASPFLAYTSDDFFECDHV